jgi:phosphoribosyl 1,2-cyclic phosphodiesterase
MDANLSHRNSADGKTLVMHHHNLHAVPEKVVQKIGEFSIMPFSLVHDVKCYGYLIKHSESGQIVFITDTLFCHYKFKGLSQIIIEANYSEEILDENLQSGKTVPKVRERVVSSHMSLETCKEFIRSNDLSKVRNIVLIHLSSSNSDAAAFSSEINQMTWKKTFVAEAGMNIKLNKDPF